MPARQWSGTTSRATTVGLVAGALGVAATLGGTAQAADPQWSVTGSSLHTTLSAGEGVTTVQDASGDHVLFRGVASIPLRTRIEGWSHIGDPDSTGGYVFDAYQSGSATSTAKMFRVTTPAGTSYEYVHPLVPGELSNNSFDAVSPDRQWMVAGEWNTMDHLQIYPTPILNPATGATGGDLALAGLVRLDHPVNDVQGCDFTSATRLVCASDDSSTALFPDDRPLLQIDLEHPLTGDDVTGHVTDLAAVPQHSLCAGTSETEGVDYDVTTGVLRAEVIQPGVCAVVTTVYTYRQHS